MAELAIGAAEPRRGGLALRRPRLPRLLGLALLAPSLVFLAVFTYWPVVLVTWQSLRVAPRSGAAVFGLGNYQAIFADPAFAHALWNNLIYAIGTTAPSLALALAFALALAAATRINTLLRSILFLPVLIPLVAAASIFLFIFLPGVGLLDYHLARLGLAGANWIGDPDIALYSLMVLSIWKNAGYYMLFFLAGLQAIPPEAYEVALIDGAGFWQRLRFVTLPYLRPTIAFVLVIALLNIVTQVDHIFVLTKGGPSDSTSLLLFYVYQEAVERYEPGKAAAATVVTLALLLALSALSLQRLERDRMAQDP